MLHGLRKNMKMVAMAAIFDTASCAKSIRLLAFNLVDMPMQFKDDRWSNLGYCSIKIQGDCMTWWPYWICTGPQLNQLDTITTHKMFCIAHCRGICNIKETKMWRKEGRGPFQLPPLLFEGTILLTNQCTHINTILRETTSYNIAIIVILVPSFWPFRSSIGPWTILIQKRPPANIQFSSPTPCEAKRVT